MSAAQSHATEHGRDDLRPDESQIESSLSSSLKSVSETSLDKVHINVRFVSRQDSAQGTLLALQQPSHATAHQGRHTADDGQPRKRRVRFEDCYHRPESQYRNWRKFSRIDSEYLPGRYADYSDHGFENTSNPAEESSSFVQVDETQSEEDASDMLEENSELLEEDSELLEGISELLIDNLALIDEISELLDGVDPS